MSSKEHLPLVRSRIIENLSEAGIAPSSAEPTGSTVPTAIDGLAIEIGSVQAIKQPFARNPEKHFASVEVKYSLAHPVWGERSIADMVSSPPFGSPKDALLFCADTLMSVSFPPVHALFDSSAPKARRGDVPFADPSTGKTVAWTVLAGGLNVTGAYGEQLIKYLTERSPVSFLSDLLGGILTRRQLHWMKINGEKNPLGLRFGCVIDGRVSQEAEERLKQRFSFVPQLSDAPNLWEFRDFLIWLPGGAPEPAPVTPAKQKQPFSWRFLGKR